MYTRAGKQENAFTSSVAMRLETRLHFKLLLQLFLQEGYRQPEQPARADVGGCWAALGPRSGKESEPLSSRRGTYLFAAVSAFCAVSLIKYTKVKRCSTSKATCPCVKFYTARL